jgi:hypothetical protein
MGGLVFIPKHFKEWFNKWGVKDGIGEPYDATFL